MQPFQWATPQQLVTNTLFDQGYSRWGVTLHTHTGAHPYTIWARWAEDITNYYYARGALGVEVTPLPLARFNGHDIANGSSYAGDIILSDEFLRLQTERTTPVAQMLRWVYEQMKDEAA